MFFFTHTNFLACCQEKCEFRGLSSRLPRECESSTFARRDSLTAQIRNEILPGKLIHNLSTLAQGTPSETLLTCFVE